MAKKRVSVACTHTGIQLTHGRGRFGCSENHGICQTHERVDLVPETVLPSTRGISSKCVCVTLLHSWQGNINVAMSTANNPGSPWGQNLQA